MYFVRYCGVRCVPLVFLFIKSHSFWAGGGWERGALARHCGDDAKVKTRHVFPAIPPPCTEDGAIDTIGWCMTTVYEFFTQFLLEQICHLAVDIFKFKKKYWGMYKQMRTAKCTCTLKRCTLKLPNIDFKNISRHVSLFACSVGLVCALVIQIECSIQRRQDL